ncbi:MAG TPA: hypothetical protein VD838_08555, partial [Anaeromyxobacteraceae bacterium]|nr:hypothetical protein [Anaeromyxobacteraceae bacterium]
MTVPSKRRRRVVAIAAIVLAAVAIAGFTEPIRERPRFTNLDGTGPAGLATVFRWAVWDRVTG